MRAYLVPALLLVPGLTGAAPPRVLEGHRGIITALAYSPDGKWLASGAQDGVVRLWDVAGLTLRAAFPGHGRMVTALAFAPDGKTLATAGYDKGAQLWDVATGKEAAASGGGNRKVLLWDVKTLLGERPDSNSGG